MADDVKSVVDVGKAQRGGSWPKPGEEGFVHPDGTPHSERQLRENLEAAANRKAAGSGVHGAPAQGGVQPGPMTEVDESDLAKARREHTAWVREAHAALAEEAAAESEAPAGKHEASAPAKADASAVKGS